MLALIACGAAVPPSHAGTIAEPSTVFYGKITGTGSAQAFPITEGELRWTIRRADGTLLPLRTKLWPVNEGEFAYRLDVPQQALSMGLNNTPGNLPLKGNPETHAVGDILVNGARARIAGLGGASFEMAQALRAATYRVDLEVATVAPDSDRDGLPDWWEKRFGRDLLPGADGDGDGLTNLQEYLAGSNPAQDSRRPSLATTAIRAVMDGTTGLALRALDSDTPPESLVYTITQLPTVGELRLRNGRPDPANPDVVLAVGSTFSQRDVLQGRVILVQAGPAAATSFGVSLHDGAAGMAPSTAAVAVTYESSMPLVSEAGAATAAAQKAWVMWNGDAESAALTIAAPTAAMNAGDYVGTYFARYGAERPQVIVGGLGNDVLAGGMAGDILAGGGGQNRLTGGGGGDRFVFTDASPGTDTVTDFYPGDGDILDLGGLFNGVAGRLQDHLKVTPEANGVRLAVDSDGTGAAATSREILLTALPASQVDLNDWVDRGALRVGALTVATRLALESTRSEAAENGPLAGELRLTRRGQVDAPLEVRLEIRGSAQNGVDYASVPTTVRFAAGQREMTLPVEPFADSIAEPAETVEVSLVASSGYEISAARAVISIADLRPVVRIEALEPLATRQPASPAVVLISRDTIVDRSLLVRIDLGGNAVNGTDYQALSRFVNLLPGQTTALVSILPNAADPAAGRARSVLVTVQPDATYLVAGTGQAEALLVAERTSFAAWRTKNFPGAIGTTATFASADPGGTGVSNLQRYAFGMDPQKPDRARMPRPVVRDGYLTVDVWRRPEAQDVVLVPEVSSTLGGWRGGPDLVERINMPEHAQNPEVISYRIRQPLSGAAQMFLNLRVEIRP